VAAHALPEVLWLHPNGSLHDIEAEEAVWVLLEPVVARPCQDNRIATFQRKNSRSKSLI
jgi:hypothetical protein